jgi:hypothetical protein
MKLVYFSTIIIMKFFIKASTFVFFAAWLFLAGCTSTKNNQCGCPNKKGLVGY